MCQIWHQNQSNSKSKFLLKLSGNNGSTIRTEVALLNWLETKIFSLILENKNLIPILGLTGSEGA